MRTAHASETAARPAARSCAGIQRPVRRATSTRSCRTWTAAAAGGLRLQPRTGTARRPRRPGRRSESPCFASVSGFAGDPLERIAQPRPRNSVLRARARPDGARSPQQPGLRRLHLPAGTGVPVRWRSEAAARRSPTGLPPRASPSARCRSSPGTPCKARELLGDRGQGRVVHEPRRLRVHPNPGLRPARVDDAADVPR